ncbi:LysE family translocator [Variovorax paradoxus]|uniref:LysE family translocator n=1 Tax=Variovorax paradoxus TaxID=34073 RepID=UPI003D65F150
MTFSTYLLFLPACFAINMAFGPNNLLSVTNGARHGVSPAVIAAGGRLAAFAIMIAVAGLGMGAVLIASELAFDVIKYIGAVYLVWIGIRLLRAPAPVAETQAPDAAAPPSMRALVRQEFTVAAGNPKAILVFTAFFPQFVVPGAYAASYLLLGVTFLLLEVVAIALYAMLGARMRRLANGSRAMRWFNKVSGSSMMIGFGLILAFTRRPAA